MTALKPGPRRLIVTMGAFALLAVLLAAASLASRSRFVRGYPGLIVGGRGVVRTFHIKETDPVAWVRSLLGLSGTTGHRVTVTTDDEGRSVGWPRLTGLEGHDPDGSVWVEIELEE